MSTAIASPSPGQPVLAIENLTVSYRQGKRWLDAVRDVDLRIMPGQTYGLVGESGSGKSTLALAVMRYLAENGAVRHGSIHLGRRDLLALKPAEMQQVWRHRVKLVPQNPLSALNPSLRVGDQLAETFAGDLSKREARERVLALLRMVRMADPARVADSYPHQLSGGMQQRVMIAMSLRSGAWAADGAADGAGTELQLLVLDEPTTNLDVTTEATILDLFRDLIRERNTAVLYVSHNLGVVTSICDRVAVLYAGELVEDASVVDLYRQPLHPYTVGLLNSVPRIGESKQSVVLRPIGGTIPQLDELPSGCVFTPRCPVAIDLCARERPPLDAPAADRRVRCHRWPEIMAGHLDVAQVAASQTGIDEATGDAPQSGDGDSPVAVVLEADGVEKRFLLRRSVVDALRGRPAPVVRAVDGVSMEIKRGKTLGLVGESGSGKTTLARCVIGLAERSSGDISLLGVPLSPGLGDRDRQVLRQIQMVFQNPEEALNPYRTVGQALSRPLRLLAGVPADQVQTGVARLLEAVNLSPTYAGRMPDQLSGGEKQRVAIARAFASQPELLIFDESVSALDVSVQASLLNMLNQLQSEAQSAYLFISHDLSVVGYLADEIVVMYLGLAMEVGSTEQIFAPPYHPYTEALLSAIPQLDPEVQQKQIRLEGDVPSPVNVPGGCRFHTRCPRFLGDICVQQEPPWQSDEQGHRIYCHIPVEELRRLQQHLFRFVDER